MAEVKERTEQNQQRESGGSSSGGSQQQQRPQRNDRGGKSRYRRRVCRFCHNKDLEIDYKRVDILVRCVSNKGKILPRRLTGNCAKHQRFVAKAIKRSRMAGFMPFTVQ